LLNKKQEINSFLRKQTYYVNNVGENAKKNYDFKKFLKNLRQHRIYSIEAMHCFYTIIF